MENITYEINGYTAIFKSALTFGQKRQLQKLMSSAMSIDAETNKANTNISGQIVYESQDMVMKMMLVSLKDPTGKLYEGDAAYKAIQEFTGDDEATGKALYEKVDEITGKSYLTEESKKK